MIIEVNPPNSLNKSNILVTDFSVSASVANNISTIYFSLLYIFEKFYTIIYIDKIINFKEKIYGKI